MNRSECKRISCSNGSDPGSATGVKGSDSKKYTQLPFKPSAAPELIPKRFKAEYTKYDGTSNPQEHIMTYTTLVQGNDLAQHEIEFVLLKKFSETLTNGALTWYSLLPEHFIDSFEILADSFIKAHDRARKVHARKADIFRISQGESELLREFESLLEFQATTWADVHNRYEIRIEDLQLGSSVSFKERNHDRNQDKFKNKFDTDRRSSRSHFQPYERADGRGNKGFQSLDRFASNRRADHGRSNRSLQEKEASGSQDAAYTRLSDYNFNISLVELVSAMRNIKDVRFLKPIRSDPSQKDLNLWCAFHGIQCHRTVYE
uniref:Retrotransposon gag domain-containing protein n=1 Tax=Nicotiana tabacum TaxID=4097 RepID=A0A1S3XWF2_TOBAC|nr:PREDICTED: uncharacterized protein LOC107769496 [Nicotiana tabacum]